MARYTHVVLVALLVVTAGCSGTLLGSETDATPTPTPTANPSPPDGSVAPPGGEPATGDVLSRPEPGGAGTGASLGGGEQVAPDVRSGLTGASFPAVGDAGTIAVSGAGQVTAAPDLALVTVSVQAEADTADGARERLATDVSGLRDALRDLGVADADVRTTSYHVSPRYAYSRETPEVTGYVATHRFQISAGVDAAGSVVDTAVGNGADRVDGVQFTLTDETRRDLRRQALADAVADARADADAVAAAADVTVTGVYAASTSGPAVTPYYGRLAEAGGAAGGVPTTFDAGAVTVTASVDIAYTFE